jgi:hypothetical protein
MGIKVNISNDDKEASKANVWTLLPNGWYNFELFDASGPEKYKSVANKDRPYYEVVVRVTEGDFAGRKLSFVRIPLFTRWNNDKKSSTNFISFFESLTDADGNRLYAEEVTDENGNVTYELPDEFEVPEPEDLLEARITARVRIKANEYQGKTEDRNEVAAFRAYDPDADDPSPTRDKAVPVAEDKPAAKGTAKVKPARKGSLDL